MSQCVKIAQLAHHVKPIFGLVHSILCTLSCCETFKTCEMWKSGGQLLIRCARCLRIGKLALHRYLCGHVYLSFNFRNMCCFNNCTPPVQLLWNFQDMWKLLWQSKQLLLASTEASARACCQGMSKVFLLPKGTMYPVHPHSNSNSNISHNSNISQNSNIRKISNISPNCANWPRLRLEYIWNKSLERSNAKQMKRWLLEEVNFFFWLCHVMLVGWTTIKEKCLREGSSRRSGSGKLGMILRMRSKTLPPPPPRRRPGAGTHRRTMTRPLNAPTPPLLPLASMQTLDAAIFESRFQNSKYKSKYSFK